jgi:hypothetical protein
MMISTNGKAKGNEIHKNKRNKDPYEGGILWSANEGFPGEEVGFGDRS